MIEIDPLETASKPAFHWLDQHRMCPFEQSGCDIEGGQQAIGYDHHIVGGGHQPGKALRASNDVEPSTGTLAIMLQLHQLRGHAVRNADDPLAVHGEGQ